MERVEKPSVSERQHDFMEAVAHNPAFAREAGVPQSVGREFAEADEKKADKVSKESVDYSHGMPARHCGICVHFQSPHSCERVEGDIDPDYWCELFKKKIAKEQPSVAGVHFGTALGNAERDRKARSRRFKQPRGHGRFGRYKPRPVLDDSLGLNDAKSPAKVVTDTGIGTEKADWSVPFKVAKADEEQRLIFGWASVVEISGQEVVDRQGDIISPEELESAAYDFVLSSRAHGHMHDVTGTGQLVESMVFTKEKQAALGIDIGKVAWWVGFYVESDDVWDALKRGELPEFSIGGKAVPVPVEELNDG